MDTAIQTPETSLAFLFEHGALGQPDHFDCPIGLTNPIHPVFDPSRWRNVEPEVMPLLRIVLRLASRFLTVETSRAFWVRLTQAKAHYDLRLHRLLLFLTTETNDETSALADELIRDAAEYMYYTFDRTMELEDQVVEGMTHLEPHTYPSGVCPRIVPEEHKARFGARMHISIHTDFHDYLLEYVRTNGEYTRGEAALVRVLFQLAVILVHELSHAIEGLRYYYEIEDYEERLYFSRLADFAEIGFEWEKTIFPFRMTLNNPVGDSVLPKFGLWAGDFSNLGTHVQSGLIIPLGDVTRHALPMEWIAKFLQDDFWNRERFVNGWADAVKVTFTLRCSSVPGHSTAYRLTAVGPRRFDLRQIRNNPQDQPFLNRYLPEVLNLGL